MVLFISKDEYLKFTVIRFFKFQYGAIYIGSYTTRNTKTSNFKFQYGAIYILEAFINLSFLLLL